MIRCIVVDDEVNARNGITEYISEVPFLKLEGTFDNPSKALQIMEHVDLVFLDIQMPGMDGITFIKTLKNPPLIILTTAFPEYALEGYQLEVLDYLVKPFPYDRFLVAVNKANALLQLQKRVRYDDFIFVKTDKGFERVENTDIIYIQGLQNYVIIHCFKRQLVVYTTLKGIESFLHPDVFLRVQKSYIVNVTKVERFHKDELAMMEGAAVPVSKKNREETLEKLFKNRVFKR